MPRWFGASMMSLMLASLFAGGASGCRFLKGPSHPTPASAGINTRDLIDPIAQEEAERLAPTERILATAERLRKERQFRLVSQAKTEHSGQALPARNVLCLSGGGSYGAYCAGVLVGWSERGDRPCFDVVTGISTGALIAVPAFLGPKYDPHMTQFYTQIKNRDLFRFRPIHVMVGDSLTDTTPMASRIDAFMTPEVMHDLSDAYHHGRRLYIGTTEQEGKQFVVWDVTAIAARNGPGDRNLIIQILLGTTAAPGLFPPAKINVSVDGVCYTERHVDGGVTQSLFFRPPYTPAAPHAAPAEQNLAATKVYVIVAGKLAPDPEVVRPKVVPQVRKSVATIINAQSRGDLQRLYFVCVLAGMDYYLSAIPADFELPMTLMEFKRGPMTELFEEGRRVAQSSHAWRTTPPGFEHGETTLSRSGTQLTYEQRGPLLPIKPGRGRKSIPPQVPNP